jgi:hypothetical protein
MGLSVALLSVEPAVLVERELDQGAHRRDITDVGPRGDRAAARRCDLVDDARQRVGVASAEHNLIPRACESLRRVGADAPARSGDQGNSQRLLG